MWKWIVGLLAIAGVISAATLARRSVAPQPVPPPIGEPVRNPFSSGIAGAGLVEPASENVVIGVSEAGLVLKVYVKEGDKVKAGDPLFETDSRLLQSQLVVAKANVADAQASLDRVAAYRRKEEEPPLRAKVEQAKAALVEAQRAVQAAQADVETQDWSRKDVEARIKRLERTVKANATPEEELERAQFLLKIAEAKLVSSKEAVRIAQSRVETAYAGVHQAEADLNLFLAGAWEADVKKAHTTLDQAKAQVKQLEMEIARRTVRSPLNATVLRVNLREGEYASIGTTRPEDAAMVLGDLSVMNVRVDIDEFDARRFTPGAKAVALLKGGGGKQIPLEFVRVEPFVIPKRQLTNTPRELVDTRVLQVIFKISDQTNVYVGQQLDVFIEAAAE